MMTVARRYDAVSPCIGDKRKLAGAERLLELDASPNAARGVERCTLAPSRHGTRHKALSQAVSPFSSARRIILSIGIEREPSERFLSGTLDWRMHPEDGAAQCVSRRGNRGQRSMTLKVIGAGFGRTGTLSLKLALEELGLGPCYHMIEVNAHPEHDALWLALAKGESSDWRPMLHGFASTVDWPTTYIWKELAAANPQGKIILTLRDPDAWYASAAATIFARMLEFESMRASPDAVDPARRRHMEMINTLIVEKHLRRLARQGQRDCRVQRA